MTCAEMKQLVQRGFRSLSRAERVACSHHLDGCQTCKEEVNARADRARGRITSERYQELVQEARAMAIEDRRDPECKEIQ